MKSLCTATCQKKYRDPSDPRSQDLSSTITISPPRSAVLRWSARNDFDPYTVTAGYLRLIHAGGLHPTAAPLVTVSFLPEFSTSFFLATSSHLKCFSSCAWVLEQMHSCGARASLFHIRDFSRGEFAAFFLVQIAKRYSRIHD
jgi:hypothetical protein